MKAQTTRSFALQISAAVQQSPAQIVLSWPQNSLGGALSIYRRAARSAGDYTSGWTQIASTPSFVTSYTDTNVQTGVIYEYRVLGLVPYYADYLQGMIAAGIGAPAVENRGKVVLVVDATRAAALAAELARLQQDLMGDGWTVLRHDVQPTDTATSVKALIQADYNADPTNVSAVLLLGAIPVPLAGPVNPDGHADHYGPWPADVYYGVVSGQWTPGVWQGGIPYFANTGTPAPAALAVGRIDLSNMPVFAPKTETDLLRQYLDKDHNFRHRVFTAARRGVVTDHFSYGYYLGIEDFAGSGYNSFAALFGASAVSDTVWIPATGDVNDDRTLPALSRDSYLWSDITTGGLNTYNGVYYSGMSLDWAARDPQTVFTLSFGSYFGDWAKPDSYLRAPLGDSGQTLSSLWSGRPRSYFHRMGMGMTLGDSVRVSENTNGEVYTGLMGDPTLTSFPVVPPSGLVAQLSGTAVKLCWAASSDSSLQGYNVYRAATANGPFTRLNSSPVTATTYTDPTPLSGANCYMARAVRLETTASGTYYNLSQGVFQGITVGSGAPSVSLCLGNGVLTVPVKPGDQPSITLCAVTGTAGASVSRVSFYANGQLVAQCSTASTLPAVANGAPLRPAAASVPAYTATWTGASAGVYQMTAVATDASGSSTTSEPVTLSIRTLAAPTISAKLASAPMQVGPGAFEVDVIGLTAAPGDQVVKAQLLVNGGVVAETRIEDVPYNFNVSQSLEASGQAIPFPVTWSGVPNGNYSVVARAVTRFGLTVDAAPIAVSVGSSVPSPSVSITTPSAGASLLSGVATSVTVSATPAIPGDSITRVELYANGTLVDTSRSTPFTLTLNAGAPGACSLAAIAYESSGAYATSAPVAVSIVSVPSSLQINSGGSAVGAFFADAFYSGGSLYSTASAIDISGATNPAPAAVYQTVRYSTAFGYNLTGLTPGGTYQIRLHFAEPVWTVAGKRPMNVTINGSTVLSAFDVFTEAGGANRAVVKETSTTADGNGRISIGFAGIPGSTDLNAMVSGIEAIAGRPSIPQAPQGLAATAAVGQVGLSWKPVTGAVSYNVYRSTAAGGEGTTPYRSGLASAAFTDAGLTNGTPYFYRVTAVNSAGESGQSSEISATPAAAQALIQLNTGGGAAGNFAADAYFSAGSVWTTTAGIDLNGAIGPAPMAVYQSVRYATQFSYTLTGLTAGNAYRLRLHFAEPVWTAAGKRPMNISVNGAAALSGFDVFTAAGGANRAIVKEVAATADSSGRIVVGFSGIAGSADLNAMVCGLEVTTP